MANVFIIWDNKKIAQDVCEQVSKRFPGDRFIVGGESNDNLSITSDILVEMNTSDFTICLISRVPLSENLLYELGYLSARLQDSYRVLVFLINQNRVSLPFDISVNRSFEVNTHPDPQPLYDLVYEKYRDCKHRDLKECGQKYITIFNNWPSTKRQLSNLKNGVLNPERIRDCVIHSIISTYYYGQNEQQDLLSLCRELPNQNGTLTPIKDVITLIAEHYNIGAIVVSKFPLILSEEEDIWLRFYAALYNGLQAVTLVNRKLIEEKDYRLTLEESIRYLTQARSILDEINQEYFQEWETPNFYISLLKGFLWNNLAAAYWAKERLYGDAGADVQSCLRKSIEFREMALKSYDALAQVDKSGVILDALEKEYCWGILKEIEYLEEMRHIDCQNERAKLEKRIERIDRRKLIQSFLDE